VLLKLFIEGDEVNMNNFRLLLIFCLDAFLFSCNHPISTTDGAQTSVKRIPHLERQGTATRLVVEGNPFLMFCGELHNSTAGGFEYLRPVWEKMAKKNLNSVIATVSWELVEPEEGKFDFTWVDSIIIGARNANLKLVLIWFASWKNGGSVYIPAWVKKDYKKFPRVRDEQGKPMEILSTFGEASAAADAKAFAILMRHIKEVDSANQTVIMMQVENEMGILDNMGVPIGNARRDFSEAANRAYNGNVPKAFIDYLVQNKQRLYPELNKAWENNGSKKSGSWEEVFGKSFFKPDKKDWKLFSFYTEELFSAWNYAGYVEKVAAAGKKEYPIPMYVNAWLKQPFSYIPGKYPSGGPLPQVLDIWRAAAPSIDFISPDIYTDEFKWVCEEYTRNGNPLFIPETRGGETGAARALYAFGQYSAFGFAPFGIDGANFTENDPLDESYAVLQKLSSLILANQGKDVMRGILVDTTTMILQFNLGDYFIRAKLAGNKGTGMAGGLIIQTGPDEFIVAGKALDVFFIPKDSSLHIGVIAVDEGSIENGKWIAQRRLNGDEVHASTWDGTGNKLPADKVSIQKISLYRYE
jgi:beta-galactosidase GanA